MAGERIKIEYDTSQAEKKLDQLDRELDRSTQKAGRMARRQSGALGGATPSGGGGGGGGLTVGGVVKGAAKLGILIAIARKILGIATQWLQQTDVFREIKQALQARQPWESAAQRTAAITGQAAALGIEVDPELRQMLFQFTARQEQLKQEELFRVQQLIPDEITAGYNRLFGPSQQQGPIQRR